MPPPPPRAVANIKDRAKALEDVDREKYLAEVRKKYLKSQAIVEDKNSKHNMNKIQESWLKIMRSAKTKQLKKEVEIAAQNHERDVDRKDAILQMLDRDLDESEEQHQVAVRSHLCRIDEFLQIQSERLERMEQIYKEDVAALQEELRIEQEDVMEMHIREKRELQLIIQQVEQEERQREQMDVAEHQSQYELIRNKNIEEDHQMRSNLEEKIEQMKEKCSAQLSSYKSATETNTTDYRSYLAKDAQLSKHVERKLRQVERMQGSIQHWKLKIQQNKVECEERNAQLRTEKDHIAKHFQELKLKMFKFRGESTKRLTDLTVNSRNCTQVLQENVTLAERILRTAELCRKFETEREKVMPFYFSRDVDVEKLEFDDEDLKEEVIETLQEQGIDEWSYLDNFFKRENKVRLDSLAIDKEKTRLEKENLQLRSILKQFLDGVSVNENVLSRPNPLLVINGKVNLNHIPVRQTAGKKVVIEAAVLPQLSRCM
eukprot:GEMP01037405.1.p1 GENE.GEMP01037405.1~~GEMP01037405.1.p1  ORF type:complete len:504 (+),score=120.21 GEMP01037405.1:51-1514(+)